MNPNPYLPGGTVYGTLLNFRREHALWAPRMHEAPYKAPPARSQLQPVTFAVPSRIRL